MTSEAAKRLRATVRRLADELDRVGSLDDESREVVSDALAQIQSRLDRRSPEPSAEDDDDDSIVERLEELEQEFQARHPTIAGLLLQAVEALRQLGI